MKRPGFFCAMIYELINPFEAAGVALQVALAQQSFKLRRSRNCIDRVRKLKWSGEDPFMAFSA